MDTQVLEKTIVLQGLDWEPRVVGYGRMLSSPLTKNGWRIVPYADDNSNIPYDSIRRVNQLRQAGCNIVGLLVAHELETPKSPPQPVAPPTCELVVEDSKPAPNYDWIGDVVGVVGGILAVMTIGLAGLLVMGAVAGLCGSDPVLIAIVDTGPNKNQDYHRFVWYEVIRWWE